MTSPKVANVKQKRVGMPLCHNGNTIYCFPDRPCDGCVRVKTAQKELRVAVEKLRASGELPLPREYHLNKE